MPAPQLYSTETGEAINAPFAHSPGLIASGKAAYPKGISIPVVSQSGQIQNVASEDLAGALQSGFTLQSPEGIAHGEAMQEADQHPIRAGAEALARGVSVGLSDPAFRAMGADPAGLAARKESLGVGGTALEVGGAIAPMLLTGGASEAAEGGLSAAARLAPSSLISRAGGAVSEGVAKAIGSEGAQSLGARIVKNAIPMAAGSAVEGALYSSGNVASEAALGDPDMNAEKALAQIGMGTMFGGGIGALLGTGAGVIGKNLFAKPAPFVSELDDGRMMQPQEVFQEALNSPTFSEEEKRGIVAGITQKKGNAAAIQAAGDTLGAPVMEGMVSASKQVQDADSFLTQQVSPHGVAQQQLYQQGFDKAESALDSTLGADLKMSQAQVGDQLKEGLQNKLDEQYAPIKKLYDTIKESTPFIDVSDKAKQVITANIKALEDYKFTNSQVRKLGNELIENFPAIKTVDDIKRFTTQLNDSLPATASRGDRYAVGQITEKLKSLEEASVVRAAEKMAAETNDPNVKNTVLELLGQRKEANAAYSKFVDDWGTVAKALGKKSFRGAADFSDFLEGLAPEAVTKKLFTKGNSEFVDFLSKKAPEEMQLLRQYQKNAIRDAAMSDGRIQINKALGKIDDLEPEIQKALFHPEELKKIDAVRTYMEAIPKNVNPSGTSKALGIGGFFENAKNNWGAIAGGAASGGAMAGPIGAVAGAAAGAAGANSSLIRDYAIKKFISGATNSADKSFASSVLLRLEKVSNKVSSDIGGAVRGFISNSASPATYLGTKLLKEDGKKSQEDNKKFYDKQSKYVTQAASNPDLLTDNATKAVEPLQRVAPNIANAMAAKSSTAAMFLYDKMPKNPSQGLAFSAAKKWQPSDIEMSKWKRYVDAVDDPISALRGLKTGKFTMEHSEAIRTVYPELFREVTSKIMEELPKLKEELPYQKRLQLGSLFNIPTDPSLQPAFVAQMQTGHAVSMQQENNNEMSGKRTEKLNLADGSKTDTQRVLTRS